MRTRWVVGLVLGALVASGCGARWTDAQSAAVRDHHTANGDRGAAVAGAAASSSAAGVSTGVVDASAGSSGPGGAVGSVVAPARTDGATAPTGDGAAAVTGAALACAAPTTAPGVTDD